MDISAHYEKLYSETLNYVEQNNFQVDPMINASSDDRFGITLLVRPDKAIISNIQQFLNELKAVEPHQYYYPNTDIHITVLSIISCYSGFKLKHISIPAYKKLILKSIEGHKSFKINLNGITASPSSVMVQGFINNNSLMDIRNSLRENFQSSGLEQSIDKRYVLQAAHATVLRFERTVKDKEAFINILNKYRDHDFGCFHVKAIELVGNDWYQRKACVKELEVFNLGPMVDERKGSAF